MIRRSFKFSAFVFGFLILNIAQPQTTIDAEAKLRIDSTLLSFVSEKMVAGTSALIYEDGKEVYYKAVGYADKEKEVPMARNTIVQIYSMTKPVAGVALMQLFEQGKFKLDDDVAKYIPELKELKVYKGTDTYGKIITEPLKNPITVRDITRHTAGFYNGGDIEPLNVLRSSADLGNNNITLSEWIKELVKIPLFFQPGTQWEYGPSVNVQALLVERLSGESFGNYVRTHVLDPLNMSKTRYYVPVEDRKYMSAGYRIDDGGELVQLKDEQVHDYNYHDYTLKHGTYGLTSTLDDYMKFAQMLLNRGSLNGVQILNPETVELMTKNQLSENITKRSWLPSKGQVGFGMDFAVRLRPPANASENMGEVGEFFWDGAASTLFWVDPKNRLTAVFFVQVFPFNGKLHKGFRDAVYGPLHE
ncbi:serine hydrolase domain-containing protein [Aegicerativicinus sediminis]